MSVGDYLRRLVRRWRVVVTVTLLLLAVSGVISYQMVPTYESKARLYVAIEDPGGDVATALSASVYAQQQVLSYAAIASSETMAQRVIDDLGLDTTAAELVGRISTEVEFGTVLFTVVAADTSGAGARDIVSSILANYNDVIAELNKSTSDSAAVTVSAIAQPTAPTDPVTPNVSLNLLAALFAGLFLGLAGAALRDLLDNSVKGPDDVTDLETSVLGLIPKRPRAMAREVVVTGDAGPMAEAFRQVRLSLQFARIDDPPRVIVVTSCGVGEGKSFVSANLAAVYASAGLRVVLVDADLRKPVIARRLDLDSQVGFMSVMLGRLQLEEAVQQGPVDDLHVLTAGPLPPNPAEILGSDSMAGLTEKLRSDYDLVIFDTPPVLPFADARALMRNADGVVLVVDHGKTRRSDVGAALQLSRAAGSHVLGMLINRAPLPRRMNYAYASYSVAKRAHSH
jgi:receptor protein-tyrosine kinase